MFHGLRMMFLIIPPYSFIAFGIIIAICIISFFLACRICNIRFGVWKENSASFFHIAIVLIVISEVAMVITTVFMLIFTNIVLGPLSGVHSEWGFVVYQDYLNVIFYYAIYGLVYANLQFPSAFVLKKAIGTQFAGFFVCFISFNTGIWVLGNLVLGLLGIPY